MDKSTDPLHHETPEKEWNEPLLHRAARVGDDAAIGVLIAEGADPNERFRDRTPLMTAAASGDGATVETVRLLLSLGADPTILNHGESAAAYACCAQEWYGYQGGDASRLSLLLEAGAPIPLTGSEAAALVATVAATGDVDRLRILLDEGAPVNPSATEADSHLYFPLFRAAESGSVECVRLLIERGAEVAMRDHSKRTAMYYASSLEVVKLLMRHGLSLADSDYMEWSPLRDAVSDGEFGLDRVRALVAAGANVNETHDRGFTIFMSAAGSMDRSVQVLRLLVEAGADPLAVTELGWNAFHAAIDVDGEANAEQSVRDILGYLKELGVNIEQVNSRGETPLAKAVFQGRGVEVRVLCELGADPNRLGSSHWCVGGTCGTAQPLLSYVARWQIDGDEKAEALLAAGANPLVPDRDGHLPLAQAVARLCAGAADYAAAFEAFYSGLPRKRIKAVTMSDRDAFVRSVRTILRPYIESFTARWAGSVTAAVGHRQEDREELLNVIETMAAYEAWARRAQVRQ